MKKRLFSALLILCLLSLLPLSAQASEAERFRDGRELAQHIIAEYTNDLETEFTFYYTSKLDSAFEYERALDSLLSNCGVMTYRYWFDEVYRKAEILEVEYYPGFRIARAVETGSTNRLSEKEKNILNKAQQLVSSAKRDADTNYDLLLALHDRLVRQVTYTAGSDEWSSVDTAEGALLYGKADCDGYTDAFYLMATLAGFEVGLQLGQSLADDGGYVWHKWNLIKWDGVWYHMDVTWDDLDWTDRPDVTLYPYFLAGDSLMAATHKWNAAFSAYDIAPHTNWNLYFYTADNSGVNYGAYYKTLEDAGDYVAYMQSEYGRDQMHFMVDGAYKSDVQAINDALAQGGLIGRWYTWVKEVSDYTCVSVTMLE